jgi:sugar O-acyltransferase (sialic acid O-acetyltransferase NeuD family)
MTDRKPVVLFGSGPFARTLHFFFEHDSDFRIVASTVDLAHIEEDPAVELPVVPFEEVTQHYPPDEFDMFVALGYRRMNHLRAERYRQAKEKGYTLVSHVSPRASTWPDITVGDNCLILDQAIVHPYVTIGNDVIAWSGSHIGHRSVVGDHCFIASRAAISGHVTIGPYSFLGTNCTIRDSMTIGEGSAIGAGATIIANTAPWSIHAAPSTRALPGRSDRLPRF